MKLKPINEVLGTWTCSAGGEAQVFQTKKQGKHFYTRCDCCGLNQGTGKARQQSIWDNAKFIDKSSLAVPSCVDVGGFIEFEQPGRKEDTKQPEQSSDFDPSEMKTEQVQQPQKSTISKLAPFLVVAAAIGVGAWMG